MHHIKWLASKALVASSNQMIWTGYANGLLVQWDCQGNRIQEFMHSSAAIQCLCALGTRIWIGYVDGRVHFMEQDTYHRTRSFLVRVLH